MTSDNHGSVNLEKEMEDATVSKEPRETLRRILEFLALSRQTGIRLGAVAGRSVHCDGEHGMEATVRRPRNQRKRRTWRERLRSPHWALTLGMA